MRDVLITLIIVGAVPFILARPWFGVLMWCWVSYMNPHRMTWGFAYDLPFAALIAAATIASILISRESKKIPITTTSGLMLAMTLWLSMTSLIALEPAAAYAKWLWVIKMLTFTFIAIMVMKDRRRIEILIWTIVGSLSFFGVKGGAFALATGGNYRVFGPPDSFLTDNNYMALALILTLPLMRYLQLQAENRWVKWGLGAAMVLNLASIVASYSRGGLLAASAMVFVLWLRSRKKALLGALGFVVIAAGLAAAPEAWFDRMSTLQNYEEDASVNSRFDSWTFSWNVAVDRPVTGGGFGVYTDQQYQKYYPQMTKASNAHSAYFEVLAEHGFVGLAIFLGILTSAMITMNRVRKAARDLPELRWTSDLASMLQASFAGYAAGSLFLTTAFSSDLYWHLLALSVLCHTQFRLGVQSNVAATTRTWLAPAPAFPHAAPAIAPRGDVKAGGVSGFLVKRR